MRVSGFRRCSFSYTVLLLSTSCFCYCYCSLQFWDLCTYNFIIHSGNILKFNSVFFLLFAVAVRRKHSATKIDFVVVCLNDGDDVGGVYACVCVWYVHFSNKKKRLGKTRCEQCIKLMRLFLLSRMVVNEK